MSFSSYNGPPVRRLAAAILSLLALGMMSLRAITHRLTWFAMLGLAFSLPFEMVKPWAQIGPVVFTNLELAASLTMLLWTLGLGLTRRAPRWPAWLWQPLLAWALTLILSAWLAPVARDAALKFTLRSLAGVAMGLVVYDLLTHRRAASARRRFHQARLSALAWALALGALLAAALGCAEVLAPAALTSWLSLFKLQTTRVAGAIRASGSFGYANIAAQYWEVALVLLMTLWPMARLRRTQIMIGLAIVSISGALVLTASRGGLLAILLTGGLLLGASRWAQRRLPKPNPGLIQAGAISLPLAAGSSVMIVLLLAGIHLALNPVQQARLQHEVETGAMLADYAAPAHLTLVAGQRTQVPVRITNRGRLFWQAGGPEPILLSYHWLDASEEMIVWFEGDRTVLPHNVAPAESAQVLAYVLPPTQPGRYVLAWDLLQNHVAWFSTRGAALGHSQVEVIAGATSLPAQPQPPPLPASALTAAQSRAQVERLTLWRAAWLLWRQHPWLGVGPDNFRYLWGDALGLVDWHPVGQPSVLHSNSLYVEILVTLGLAGAACFAWLLLNLGRRVRSLLGQRLDGEAATRAWRLHWLLGLSAAMMVFLVHGFFDYFLEFTPTYLLWWIVIGSLAACTTHSEERVIDTRRV